MDLDPAKRSVDGPLAGASPPDEAASVPDCSKAPFDGNEKRVLEKAE
jgi:hypothetical protein